MSRYSEFNNNSKKVNFSKYLLSWSTFWLSTKSKKCRTKLMDSCLLSCLATGPLRSMGCFFIIIKFWIKANSIIAVISCSLVGDTYIRKHNGFGFLCVYTCMGVHAPVCMPRPEVSVKCLPPSYSLTFWDSLSLSSDSPLAWTGWTAAQGPTLGPYAFAATRPSPQDPGLWFAFSHNCTCGVLIVNNRK